MIILLALVTALVSCRMQPRSGAADQKKADLAPVINSFPLNLYVKGKFRMTRNQQKQTASFDIEMNRQSFLFSVFSPFGGVVYQVYADADRLSIINYQAETVENYPNTNANRVRLTGTDFSLQELITVFTGRVFREDMAAWNVDDENERFTRLEYRPTDAASEERAVVVFETYRSFDGVTLPVKIKLEDKRYDFSAYFFVSKHSLSDERPITMPDLSESFQYIDFAPQLGVP